MLLKIWEGVFRSFIDPWTLGIGRLCNIPFWRPWWHFGVSAGFPFILSAFWWLPSHSSGIGGLSTIPTYPCGDASLESYSYHVAFMGSSTWASSGLRCPPHLLWAIVWYASLSKIDFWLDNIHHCISIPRSSGLVGIRLWTSHEGV